MQGLSLTSSLPTTEQSLGLSGLISDSYTPFSFTTENTGYDWSSLLGSINNFASSLTLSPEILKAATKPVTTSTSNALGAASTVSSLKTDAMIQDYLKNAKTAGYIAFGAQVLSNGLSAYNAQMNYEAVKDYRKQVDLQIESITNQTEYAITSMKQNLENNVANYYVRTAAGNVKLTSQNVQDQIRAAEANLRADEIVATKNAELKKKQLELDYKYAKKSAKISRNTAFSNAIGQTGLGLLLL